ncbi:MAG: GrpB family protein [Lachnospiraceae bacterium]|nr:GrpB family protein [Lachnospiraceae bacterium]
MTIYLTEPQSCWKEWFSEEASVLEKAFFSNVKISHIGSTAIPSIRAKPIIDILVEIPKENNLLEYKDLIINNGYICMSFFFQIMLR